MKKFDRDTPAPDTDNVRYCSTHEMHWIPYYGMEGEAAACPWCQRDKYWDELEMIRDVFYAAVEARNRPKGGQQVMYHGDFAYVAPSTIGQMEWYVRRWDEVLGKNVRRGK